MAAVAGGDAVVHLVEGDAEVEVLRPQHRFLVGRERAQPRVAAGEPVGERGGRVRVDGQLRAVGEVGVVGVVRRRARLHPRGLADLGDRARERHPHVGADQLAALDPPRPRDLPEPARGDPQPDGALRAVLRPREQLLGDGVQRPAGRAQHLLVHVSSWCPGSARRHSCEQGKTADDQGRGRPPVATTAPPASLTRIVATSPAGLLMPHQPVPPVAS